MERADARWQAILVNGGGSVDSNYYSHRVHLDGMTDALLQRGLPADDLLVLASDGADPTPDLLSLPPVPASGAVPAWAVGPGPLTDPGGPLAHLWPPLDRIDTAWTRTAVAPATAAELRTALAERLPGEGERLLLYTTDHGEPDGSLSMWNESLPPERLVEMLAGTPPGGRVVVAMSQCHSGAFAAPLLELRERGVDVCGVFSVPADRQATGCFPDRDGRQIGHGFRVSEALARAATVAEMQDYLVSFDGGPDVPVRTSDVLLWTALLDEAERRGEDVTATADRLLSQADPSTDPAARALLVELALRLNQPVPERLATVHALSDQWFAALDVATLQVDDLAGAQQDAVLRVQQDALARATDPEPDWPALLRSAARDAGLYETLPRLVTAHSAADSQLWRLTVQEALLARMGWLLARVAGQALLADDPSLTALLACENTPLPGVTDPTPTPGWTLMGPVPTPAPLAWLGVRLEASAAGGARVVAVHPEGPASTRLVPGDRIVRIDGQPTPTVESVVARLALAVAGQSLALDTERGEVRLELAPWPAHLSPAVVPVAGDPAPDVLHWIDATPYGGHLIVWTAAACPTCAPAVERSRQWAAATGQALVVVDDVMPGGLPGATPDLGGWTADAYGVDLLPSVVAVDPTGHIAWRVDGWSPEEGVDLPPLPTLIIDDHRFPRAPPQPPDTARGTPVP